MSTNKSPSAKCAKCVVNEQKLRAYSRKNEYLVAENNHLCKAAKEAEKKLGTAMEKFQKETEEAKSKMEKLEVANMELAVKNSEYEVAVANQERLLDSIYKDRDDCLIQKVKTNKHYVAKIKELEKMVEELKKEKGGKEKEHKLPEIYEAFHAARNSHFQYLTKAEEEMKKLTEELEQSKRTVSALEDEVYDQKKMLEEIQTERQNDMYMMECQERDAIERIEKEQKEKYIENLDSMFVTLRKAYEENGRLIGEKYEIRNEVKEAREELDAMKKEMEDETHVQKNVFRALLEESELGLVSPQTTAKWIQVLQEHQHQNQIETEKGVNLWHKEDEVEKEEEENSDGSLVIIDGENEDDAGSDYFVDVDKKAANSSVSSFDEISDEDEQEW